MALDLAPDAVCVRTLKRKIAWRILPLLFGLYVIAYIDRMNIGFAKIRMQSALGWGDDVMGWGIGLFFVGYLLLEIPGALLVEHWSARKWFARILITWGFCSMGMALVRTPWQFYGARFLLGLAEAGFFPGVIVYFTHWFPRADRARAFSVLVFGVPVSQLLGSQMAAFLIEHSWLEIAGWQWIFLLEGIPAIVCGAAVPFLMTDRPRQASWLTPAESAWLDDTLRRERAAAAGAGAVTLGQALRQRSVWLLALGIMTTNTGGYAMGFWLPTFLDNMLADSGAAFRYVGLVSLCQVAAVLIAGQSSDFFGERKWHCMAGQVGAGVFLGISLIPGQPFGVVMTWLCLMGFFALFWQAPFWVLPTMSMSASAAAVSIGFINICANLAGLFGPVIVGEMKTFGFDDIACMALLACFYASGGVFIGFLHVQPRTV